VKKTEGPSEQGIWSLRGVIMTGIVIIACASWARLPQIMDITFVFGGSPAAYHGGKLDVCKEEAKYGPLS